MTIGELQQLFAFNTSQIKGRYKVFEHFCKLSLALIRDFVFILKAKKDKKKLYQFVEFEFYCLDSGLHQDVFAHCDDLQLTTCASFYFHKSGNNSFEGYQFMTAKKSKNDSKKILFPPPSKKRSNCGQMAGGLQVQGHARQE